MVSEGELSKGECLLKAFGLLCFSSLFDAFFVTPVEQSYVFRAKLFAECFQYRLVICSCRGTAIVSYMALG
jgi:hypothetical protein